MDTKQIAGIDSGIGSMEESEGDSVPGEVIIGCENPKIIEWEELQQELGRLLSLSSALKKEKERKESLTQRLESVIEVRHKYLQQSYELDEMRGKLGARKLAMGDTMMQMKETKEEVKSKTEQLGTALTSLLVAGNKVSAAHQQLQEAKRLLSGKMGYGSVKSLQKMVRKRQQHMITQVNSFYPVKFLNEPDSKEKLDICSGGTVLNNSAPSSSPESAESVVLDKSSSLPMSSVTILGQQLTTFPFKKTIFFNDKKEIQRFAIVLGYAAHAVLLVASYLDVPLRYPLHLGGSRSYIPDYSPSVETTASSDLVVSPLLVASSKLTEFPLFLEGQDSTRAAYAMFLLNKDVEQLLNFYGAESLGPRHILPNLKELLRIILSKEFLEK